MALQHREFQSRLRNTKSLRLYVQSAFVDQETRNIALTEAELNARRWESESKEAIERVARAEVERNATHHEATMAQLETEAGVSA